MTVFVELGKLLETFFFQSGAILRVRKDEDLDQITDEARRDFVRFVAPTTPVMESTNSAFVATHASARI